MSSKCFILPRWWMSVEAMPSLRGECVITLTTQEDAQEVITKSWIPLGLPSLSEDDVLSMGSSHQELWLLTSNSTSTHLYYSSDLVCFYPVFVPWEDLHRTASRILRLPWSNWSNCIRKDQFTIVNDAEKAYLVVNINSCREMAFQLTRSSPDDASLTPTALPKIPSAPAPPRLSPKINIFQKIWNSCSFEMSSKSVEPSLSHDSFLPDLDVLFGGEMARSLMKQLETVTNGAAKNKMMRRATEGSTLEINEEIIEESDTVGALWEGIEEVLRESQYKLISKVVVLTKLQTVCGILDGILQDTNESILNPLNHRLVRIVETGLMPLSFDMMERVVEAGIMSLSTVTRDLMAIPPIIRDAEFVTKAQKSNDHGHGTEIELLPFEEAIRSIYSDSHLPLRDHFDAVLEEAIGYIKIMMDPSRGLLSKSKASMDFIDLITNVAAFQPQSNPDMTPISEKNDLDLTPVTAGPPEEALII